MADPLISFTRPQFEYLMETEGLENTVKGVIEIANNKLVLEKPLTIESLSDGSHPFLDTLDRYRGIDPGKRNLSEEEILTLFTNVRDYGKYDPQGSGYSGLKAGFTGAARSTPELVGSAVGWKSGLAAAAPIANLIPPIGPWGIAAKGLVYAGGAITGAILGAIAAGEAEDAIIGEAAPVVPSLEPSYRGGETTAMGLSMLVSPWKFTKLPKAETGALSFLENFKQVSSGKFSGVADEAFQITAKNAGLSEKAATKLWEQASKARQVASERGAMFGGELGVNLGRIKFNPAGYVLDPRKGPLGVRGIAGIEKGIEASLAWARNNPRKFLATEGLTALGTGAGAYYAQQYSPYEEGDRLMYELAGSLIIPLPAQIVVDYAGPATKSVLNTVGQWWSNTADSAPTKGLLTDPLRKDSAKRIIEAIKKSEEFKPVYDEQGNVVSTGDERLTNFIAELGKAAKEDAERVKASATSETPQTPLTLADLSKTADLDFSPTLRTIQDELEKVSDDFAASTGRGREELQMGSALAIRSLASTGDPLALAYAARIQQDLFEQNILDNIDQPVTKLMDAAKRVLGKEPGAGSKRINLSKSLYEVLDKQIKRSKIREDRLWSQVKNFTMTEFYSRNGRRIQQPNVLQLLDRSEKRGGLRFDSSGENEIVEKSLGPYWNDIEDLRKYFHDGRGRNPATSARFYKMRKGVVERAAKLRQSGDRNGARYLNQIHDALLRDLTGQKDGVSEAYNIARAYTFARNNVFTRSFYNGLVETDKTRGLVLAPENLLDQLFKGGNKATVKRIEEIQSAGQFLVNQGRLTEEQALTMDTDRLVTEALRDSLDRIVDEKIVPHPTKPREKITRYVVNPKKLSDLKKEPGTQELYSLIDGLEEDLATMQSAQNAVDNVLTDVANVISPQKARLAGYTKDQVDQIYARKAFESVLTNENPQKAVGEAITSQQPTLALNKLYRIVDDTNYANSEYTRDQAMQGLKSAVFSYALHQSNKGATGNLPNGDALQKTLFGQIDNAPPNVKYSLKDFLITKGLATESEMDEVQKAIKTLRGVEEAFATGNFESVLFKKPSLAKMFYVRVGGATAGSFVQDRMKKLLGLPQMSGGLIAEQTGSELVQRVLLRGPESQRLKIMTEMFSNPELLQKLMQEINNKKQADALMGAVAKFFEPLARQTGRRVPIAIRALSEEEDYEPPPAPPQPVRPPVSPPRAMNPPAQAIPTPSRGPAPRPAQPPPAPISAAPQSSGQVDRARFAALFPEDRDLISGIGSLMGRV